MLRMLVSRFFPERAHTHEGGTFNIREIVFGFNDGLVTTFTVVVGFTGAAIGSRVIVIAALLNAVSDGLSMAFGAYLSTKSEHETYEATIVEERASIDADPGYEARALRAHLKDYGIKGKTLEAAVRQAERNKDEWARLITRDVRGLEPAPSHGPVRDSSVMFFAFLFGSLFPVWPFLFGLAHPFEISVALSVTSAFVIGSLKTVITKRRWWYSGLETMTIALFLMATSYTLGAVISALVP